MHKCAVISSLLKHVHRTAIEGEEMNDLPRRSKHSLIIVPKRIDDRTEFYPPVDYSFSELKTIDGLICIDFLGSCYCFTSIRCF